MNNTRPVFDHLGLWCADLPTSAARFEQAVGVPSMPGGRHEGQGTWNRLVGAGAGAYLELIGLDPDQDARGPIATQAESLDDLAPCLLAFRASDLGSLAETAKQAGFATPGPTSMSRDGGDGRPISWQILFLSHPEHSGLPFFIDWQDTPHPSERLGDGVSISGIWIATPKPEALSCLLGSLGLEVETRYGETARLHAAVTGPGGRLAL